MRIVRLGGRVQLVDLSFRFLGKPYPDIPQFVSICPVDERK